MDNLVTFFSQAFRRLHPADIADRIQRMPPDQGADILRKLPAKLAAESMADLAGALEPSVRQNVLGMLPGEVSRSIHALLKHHEDTAGGIMSDRFITLQLDETVECCLKQLRSDKSLESEDISYLYVVDKEEQLQGIVTFRDLVFSSPTKAVRDIMRDKVTTLRVTDDQEEISRQFAHYHYLGLPVLDEKDRVVGVVKASDVIEIAREEATEDMQLMVGLSGEERTLTPWQKSLPRRLPWLYVNLLTAFAAAGVVGWFESIIAEWTVLAVFLPVVAGQGGNAGVQTLTVIIRDMALGEINKGDAGRALAKELILGAANGIAIGIVVGLVGYLWKGSFLLGAVACLAMIFNQLVAGLAGVLIPFSLKFLRVDPAMASSIFVTTITDIAGFLSFLGFATLAMRVFGMVP